MANLLLGKKIFQQTQSIGKRKQGMDTNAVKQEKNVLARVWRPFLPIQQAARQLAHRGPKSGNLEILCGG
eukprot:scaffold1244_cov162-Ochromonas_danica.AAC.15